VLLRSVFFLGCGNISGVFRCPQVTGHGAKLPRKQGEAIIALLKCRTVEEAAQSIGIAPKTLYRWMKLPDFDHEHRDAMFTQFRQSLARLQQAALPAVTVLRNGLADPQAPLAVRARCAFYILDQTRKAMETDVIEARLAALEKATSETNGKAKG
jgi:hypothetical protein